MTPIQKLAPAQIAQLTKGMGRYEGFKTLIDYNNYKVGVEVGVREGRFSNFLTFKTSLSKVYGIDICWSNGAKALSQLNPNYEFIHNDAFLAVHKFPDEYFDFIHLDADHTYDVCLDELYNWWFKLKPGGIISGDDFMDVYDKIEGQFGVQKAVNEFVTRNKLQFYIIGLAETDMSQLNAYGKLMGEERTKKQMGQKSIYFEAPNYFIVKES